MDDAKRLTELTARFVCRVQPAEGAGHDCDCNRRRQVAFRGLQQAGERLAVHVLHHDHEPLIVLDHVQRLNDVGMADPGGEPRFICQHRYEHRFARVLWMEPLERHGAAEATWTTQAAEVHRAHPAGGKLSMDGVAPHEPRATVAAARLARQTALQRKVIVCRKGMMVPLGRERKRATLREK